MKNYIKNQALLESVASNNVEEIKIILIDLIIFFQGNPEEINEAVSYAVENSKFTFELHKDLPNEKCTTKEELFIDEKFNMRLNYSKERFNRLVELYNESYALHEYPEETGKVTADNSKLLKIIAISITVLVVGYGIIKMGYTNDSQKKPTKTKQIQTDSFKIDSIKRQHNAQ